jgi:hypothetical protein
VIGDGIGNRAIGDRSDRRSAIVLIGNRAIVLIGDPRSATGDRSDRAIGRSG